MGLFDSITGGISSAWNKAKDIGSSVAHHGNELAKKALHEGKKLGHAVQKLPEKALKYGGKLSNIATKTAGKNIENLEKGIFGGASKGLGIGGMGAVAFAGVAALILLK